MSEQSASRPALMPVAEASTRLLDSLRPMHENELLALEHCRGRVLADDLTAPINVPPFAVSAMDGYALRAAESSDSAVLQVSQRIAAGQCGQPLAAGQVARIFTGAPIPPGANAVVMQENANEEGADSIRVNQAAAVGENIRPQGDDVVLGQRLFAAGHRLRPQDLGVLAAVGLSELKVRRQLRVALLTTGDELVEPGEALGPGQIYNANLPALRAALEQLALVEVIDLGRVGDSLAATRELLAVASASADCLISTGGVSVGEEDHVRAALEAEGQIEFWKLALKPGKPFTSGKLGHCQFFGLPGNPVSAFVTFCVLVRPAMLSMLGCSQASPLSFPLPAGFALPKNGERQEYLRVKLAQSGSGCALQLYDNQSSGVSASLSASDGLAIRPPFTEVKQGDALAFIPYSELLA